jgi:hypothetical protein
MRRLFSPVVELRAPAGTVRNVFERLDVILSRKEPADVAEFTLRKGLPDVGLAREAPVEIWIRYDREAWRVFAGYVVEDRRPAYLCKDEAVKLFRTSIVRTFVDVTPHDVLRYALQQAGVAEYVLADCSCPRKPVFVAAGENVSDLVRRVNATWGLGHDWYFDADRRFHWDPPVPQPGPVFRYEYGRNIIELDFQTEREPHGQRAAGATSGAGRLLTVASPFVAHSREISIVWPEVKQSRFFVECVRHFLNEKGGLRTEIYFRELPG